MKSVMKQNQRLNKGVDRLHARAEETANWEWRNKDEIENAHQRRVERLHEKAIWKEELASANEAIDKLRQEKR